MVRSGPAQSSNKSGRFGFYAYEVRERRPHLPDTSYSDGIYKIRPEAVMNLRVFAAAACRMDSADKSIVVIGANP